MTVRCKDCVNFRMFPPEFCHYNKNLKQSSSPGRKRKCLYFNPIIKQERKPYVICRGIEAWEKMKSGKSKTKEEKIKKEISDVERVMNEEIGLN